MTKNLARKLQPEDTAEEIVSIEEYRQRLRTNQSHPLQLEVVETGLLEGDGTLQGFEADKQRWAPRLTGIPLISRIFEISEIFAVFSWSRSQSP